MSIGLISGLLILLYVLDEVSFDEFHSKKNRIFKVVTTTPGGEMEMNAWPVAHLLKTNFPEVEKAVYTRGIYGGTRIKHENTIYTHTSFFAGAEFFEMFDFTFTEGASEGSLDIANSVVITESLREQYFGNNTALGKSITTDEGSEYTIAGVILDPPKQSHIQFELLISFKTFEDNNEYFSYSEGWGNFNVRNYILLTEKGDIESLKEKSANLYRENIGDWMDEMGVDFTVDYIPLKDIYLKSDVNNGFGPKGSLDQVILISAIGIFIILLACINFINLSTARSVFRAKEVGIKKLMGSSRSTLFVQFITEAFLLIMISFVVVIFLLDFTLPFFNELMQKSYELKSLLNSSVISGAVLMIVAMSLLSGYYPAVVLSGMRLTEAIKGRLNSGQRGAMLRRTLIVFQFGIGAVLVLGTLLVTDQLQFMKDQDLGFDKEQIIVLNTTYTKSNSSPEVLKSKISQISAVEQVSFTNALPGRPGWQGQWAFPEEASEDNHVDTEYMAIDENYIKTLGLQLIAGRNFDLNRPAELDEGLIVNETTVREMGWKSPADAIGRRIVSPSQAPAGIVIGVVKDYHGLGLQYEIWPKAMDYASQRYGRYYAVRFATGQTSRVLEDLKSAWREVYPDYPVDYFFLDEEFERQYNAEERLMTVFMLFAGIGIAIACIGLLGLVSFMINSRIREVCVRKIHGAGMGNIGMLLSREFIGLIVISNLLVLGPVWYFGNRWMENFAYHTTVDPMSFIITFVLMIVLAAVTVGYQMLSAARVNPAKLLRAD